MDNITRIIRNQEETNTIVNILETYNITLRARINQNKLFILEISIK